MFWYLILSRWKKRMVVVVDVLPHKQRVVVGVGVGVGENEECNNLVFMVEILLLLLRIIIIMH